MKKYIRLIALVFAAAIMVSSFSGCGDKTSKYTSYDLYAQTESPTPYMLSDGKTAGVYVNPVKPFCGFEVTLTSVGESENKVSLAVYKFEMDYETSLSRSPISAGVFENVEAGEKLYLHFEDMPAGRYIFTVSSTGADIGIYRHASVPSVEEKAHFYYHFLRLESGAFPFSLVFRTSNVRNLEAADVLGVPDYSWTVDTPSSETFDEGES